LFCFSSELRLKSKEDFQNLRSGSLRISTESIIIYYKKNIHQHARVGLSVSRKVSNAVVRNKLKRIARDVFRLSDFRNKSIDCLIVFKSNFQFKPGWNISLRNELLKSFSTMSFHN
jgi:ribonuclease P protein component